MDTLLGRALILHTYFKMELATDPNNVPDNLTATRQQLDGRFRVRVTDNNFQLRTCLPFLTWEPDLFLPDTQNFPLYQLAGILYHAMSADPSLHSTQPLSILMGPSKCHAVLVKLLASGLSLDVVYTDPDVFIAAIKLAAATAGGLHGPCSDLRGRHSS